MSGTPCTLTKGCLLTGPHPRTECTVNYDVLGAAMSGRRPSEPGTLGESMEKLRTWQGVSIAVRMAMTVAGMRTLIQAALAALTLGRTDEAVAKLRKAVALAERYPMDDIVEPESEEST